MNLRFIERQIQEKHSHQVDSSSITHKGVQLGTMGQEEYRMNKRLLKQIRATKKAATHKDEPGHDVIKKPTLLF